MKLLVSYKFRAGEKEEEVFSKFIELPFTPFDGLHISLEAEHYYLASFYWNGSVLECITPGVWSGPIPAEMLDRDELIERGWKPKESL